MADLIREAAETAVRSLYDPKRLGRPLDDVSMLAVIEASFREKFTGAGLEDALPCTNPGACSENEGHYGDCPAFYILAVAALIEARVAAALERAAKPTVVAQSSPAASSEPGSEK